MMFSTKNLIHLIFPLIIQQALNATIGMIDSMMVSSAGEAAVSGVSLVNSLDVLLIYAFSSLVTGGSIVVSQSLGKNDMNLVRSSAKQLLYVATFVATALSMIVSLLMNLMNVGGNALLIYGFNMGPQALLSPPFSHALLAQSLF